MVTVTQRAMSSHGLRPPFPAISCAQTLITRVWRGASPCAAEVPDLENLLARLEEVLHGLLHELLTPEQTHHVMYQAMPKLVLMLLKLRCKQNWCFD